MLSTYREYRYEKQRKPCPILHKLPFRSVMASFTMIRTYCPHIFIYCFASKKNYHISSYISKFVISKSVISDPKFYFSISRSFSLKSSSSTLSSTPAGAPVIRSCPLFVLGNGITSFIEDSFSIAISHLSIPNASPP